MVETANKKRTIKDWLTELGAKNESSEEDSASMQHLMRNLGFSRCVVVIGIVYPDGHGQPIDIHSMARMLLQEWASKA